MDTNKKIEFIKTTTSKLDNGDVEAVYPSESYIPIIHTQDENSNGTTDDQLYIGEDRITDKFNLGNTDLSGATLPVGGLEATTFDRLKTRSISDILIDILTPISVSSVSLDQNTMILMIGDTGVLTATVLPANASDKTVTWSSSNENVITVNDIKTHGKILPEFKESIQRFHYMREMAMYSWLLSLCAKKYYNLSNPTIKGNYLVVSTIPKYYTKVVPMTNSMYIEGWNDFRRLLRIVAYYYNKGYRFE